MKKIILSNIVILFVILFYWQMNASLFSFIHFDSSQSFFTRLDYFWMFLICLVVLIVLVFFLYKLLKKEVNVNLRKILLVECGILMAIGSILGIVYAYSVFNPSEYLSRLLEFNRLYKVWVMFFFVEVFAFSYASFKLLR